METLEPLQKLPILPFFWEIILFIYFFCNDLQFHKVFNFGVFELAHYIEISYRTPIISVFHSFWDRIRCDCPASINPSVDF